MLLIENPTNWVGLLRHSHTGTAWFRFWLSIGKHLPFSPANLKNTEMGHQYKQPKQEINSIIQYMFLFLQH